MTQTHIPTGRRRRALLTTTSVAPGSAESVPQPPPAAHSRTYPQDRTHPQDRAHPQDPPIYRALLRHWADRGRTLPGRHDPEWVRLAAPTVRVGQFSAIPDRRGDGR
ncbi:hypothetical protein ACQB60_16200 [Actinomycetota bacterium Odt1-20B]